jgi:hypothetical protein
LARLIAAELCAAVSYPLLRFGHRASAGDALRCFFERMAGSSDMHVTGLHVTGCWNADASHAIRALALLTVISASALLCPIAAAETTEERQSCIGDAFRVCWAAIPNRDDVFHCLMDNRSQLNPGCRAIMDQYRRPHRVRRTARHRVKSED